MPKWLINLYISLGMALSIGAGVGLVGWIWWLVSNGAWWGLLGWLGTLVFFLVGVPTILWLLGIVK